MVGLIASRGHKCEGNERFQLVTERRFNFTIKIWRHLRAVPLFNNYPHVYRRYLYLIRVDSPGTGGLIINYSHQATNIHQIKPSPSAAWHITNKRKKKGTRFLIWQTCNRIGITRIQSEYV